MPAGKKAAQGWEKTALPARLATRLENAENF
jgi:hypothetical protein